MITVIVIILIVLIILLVSIIINLIIGTTWQLEADRGPFHGCLSPRDGQSLGSKTAGVGEFVNDNDDNDDHGNSMFVV